MHKFQKTAIGPIILIKFGNFFGNTIFNLLWYFSILFFLKNSKYKKIDFVHKNNKNLTFKYTHPPKDNRFTIDWVNQSQNGLLI